MYPSSKEELFRDNLQVQITTYPTRKVAGSPIHVFSATDSDLLHTFFSLDVGLEMAMERALLEVWEIFTYLSLDIPLSEVPPASYID